jgi:hypothetical protein
MREHARMAVLGTDQTSGRTETQSVETSVRPDAVVAVLADARNLPTWAPGFVDAVVGDAESGWVGTKGDQSFAIRVPVNAIAGTVDYLREISPGREGGAYLRAVPRPGSGTVIVMTLPILPGSDRAATAAILTEELAALASLVGQTG